MCGQRYSEVTCAFSLIKFLTSCHFRSEVYSKVESEPKDEVATIKQELKFRKRMVFCVLGSLITVPLHSTLAVNNLGLNLFLKMCD